MSSDSDKILNISKKYGAKPYKRPSKFSLGSSSSEDVILNIIRSHNSNYNYAVLLQPTSPLRTSRDIDNAIKLLFQKKKKNLLFQLIF